MKKRNVVLPLLATLMSGAVLSMSEIAVAQPVAPASQTVIGGDSRVIINPRIMLSLGEQDRLQMYADRGPDALRRYLWRTRVIYNYYLPDLANVG